MTALSATSLDSPKRSRRQRLARAFLIYVLVPYISVTLIFTLLQRKLMYRPTKALSLKVADLRLDPAQIKDVQLQTSDGTTLNGWLLVPPTTSSDDPEKHAGEQEKQTQTEQLVIYFPGNAQNRSLRRGDLEEIARCGFHVLIFDYRGYGDSSGSPSETGIAADAREIWKFAHDELSFRDEQIVLFGESLGGAVALSLWSEELGDHPRPQAVLLSSTFASMPRTVACNYPWFLFHYLVLDQWRSIDRISMVKAPIRIFHGTSDKLIPMEEARALAIASGDTSRLTEIPGGEHNDIPMQLLRQELRRIRDTANGISGKEISF
jgi:pimeloyl-ACP methyl ester carboxylesterase